MKIRKLAIGYEKIDGIWSKLSYDTLMPVLRGEDESGKEYLIYHFDFVGAALAEDEDVNEKELIDMAVHYQ